MQQRNQGRSGSAYIKKVGAHVNKTLYSKQHNGRGLAVGRSQRRRIDSKSRKRGP